MENLFIIGLLLLCFYVTMNKTNTEHMTSDTLNVTLIDYISNLNNQLNNMKGIIVAWNGITPPTGWALCDGKNGTPDLSGRFIFGYSPNNDLAENGANDAFNPTGGKYQRYSYAIGKVGGETVHTLSINEIPSHNHAASPSWLNNNGTGTQITGAHDGTFTSGKTGLTGGGAYHNNIPPYYVLAYIMKL